MKTKFSALLASAAVATLASSFLAPSAAQAFSLSFDSTSTSSNSPATGASALVDFTFTQSGNDVLLDLNLTNTTGTIPSFGAGATQATLVGFGFDMINSITAFTYNFQTSAFTKLYGDSSLNPTVLDTADLPPFTNGPGQTPYDVGIRSTGTGNFGGGNPTAGLTAGNSTSVQFLLSGANLNAASVESSFLAGFQNGTLRAATRFQQVNAGEGSDKLTRPRIVTNTPDPDPQPVPEPASLLGLGLVASGMVVARRRRAAAQN